MKYFRLSFILLLLFSSLISYSQFTIDLPRYEVELIRNAFFYEEGPKIELDHFEGRKSIEHRIIDSSILSNSTYDLCLLVVGSTIGEGDDCNSCGSILNLYVYKIEDESVYKKQLKMYLGSYGNQGYFPLSVSLKPYSENSTILSIGSINKSPGNYYNLTTDIFEIESNNEIRCNYLVTLSNNLLKAYIDSDSLEIEYNNINEMNYELELKNSMHTNRKLIYRCEKEECDVFFEKDSNEYFIEKVEKFRIGNK